MNILITILLLIDMSVMGIFFVGFLKLDKRDSTDNVVMTLVGLLLLLHFLALVGR